MKTTLIVIQNEADHADAKKLIEKLMRSSDPQDRARMVAQARLVDPARRMRLLPRNHVIQSSVRLRPLAKHDSERYERCKHHQGEEVSPNDNVLPICGRVDL
jgi:hypothetical protein